MDDTLYLERDYIYSGFNAVANHIASRHTISENEITSFLWAEFINGVRGNAFDRLVDTYPSLKDDVDPLDLVSIYRNHTPAIELFPEIKYLLTELSARKIPLGLISDGPYQAQANKVKALCLNKWISTIILTDHWGRNAWKPSQIAFIECEKQLNLPGSSLVYIGDNPTKDFIAPKERQWATVQLEVNNRIYREPSVNGTPDFKFNDLDEMCQFILGQI